MMGLMKNLLLCGILAIPVVSCQTVSQLDSLPLTRAGRQFQERGALGTDCGIVNQVETGRLGSGSSAGGGGGC